MKIAILTAGRFHVLDLARELTRLGHEVAFYSLVPPWTTRRFGLPPHADRWLGPLLGPAFLASRALARTPARGVAQRALVEAIDRVGERLVGSCDAFIGMAGMSLRTLRRARRRGAVTFVERGSLHIAAQQAILADAGPRGRVADWVVAREEAEYAAADYVSVPSRLAERSFVERGVPAQRLVRNPYGVSLDEFPPTPAPPGPPRILYVGTWSWQKGVDVLARAFEQVRAARPGAELVHVGAVGDTPLPARLPGFTHIAPVPQPELTRHYARAHVFTLPSRQDGFGMVLTQALASGLPVVATTRTGGPDLADLLGADDAITLVPPDDADALAAALGAQLDRVGVGPGPRAGLVDARRQALTWRAYGERWDANLRALVPR
ncbi:MAG: glycosyltransferase family 4 protein [Deltaproteobacteria bacterium]|nr:glycosyltransferase family 4 protein [Deltaproteobacteria bacterium]